MLTASAHPSSACRACFVIGHPIAHSRSPMIHGYWLKQLSIAGRYDRIDVEPWALPAFVDRIRAGEFAGGNVTVPHKQSIIPLLDRLTEDAAALGAVNTVYSDGALIWGHNTDAAGFLVHLEASAPGWADRVETALILGAGGAAFAVAHALLGRVGGRIIVANRNPARSKALKAHFSDHPSASRIEILDWDQRSDAVAEADLIVNTTSLGMKGQPELDLDLRGLKASAIVDDIVYVPLETTLLREARRRGAIGVDGLGMLLNQAAPGFERWFGRRPVVTSELRRIVETDITGMAS